MAAARVRSLGTAGSSAAVGSINITVTAATAVDNLIVVGHAAGGSSVIMSGVTDSRGNTYTVQVSKPTDTGTAGTNPGSSIASAVCTTALQVNDTITVTLAGTGFVGCWAAEYSGIDTTTPVRTTGNNNSGGVTVTSFDTASTDPSVTAGDILVGNVAANGTVTLTGTSSTVVGQQGVSSGTTRPATELSKAVASTGTDDLTVSLGTARAATGEVVVFAVAPAAAALPFLVMQPRIGA